MSHSDLTALLDEVNFSTPERAFREESTERKANPDLGSENERKRVLNTSRQNKRVLIVDSSLTRPSKLIDTFDEKRIDTVPTSSYGIMAEGGE